MTDPALAQSFLRAGEDYERFRPGFPDATAAMLLPDRVPAALDLGAGTGKFTERLVGRAEKIYAVDPSPAMLAVLRRRLPLVDVREGTAEDIPLPDASVQVVTVAQAFHWFDRDAACAQVRRVLVAGGALGVLWNRSDPECTWDVECSLVAHPGVVRGRRDGDPEHAVLPGFHFETHERFRWSERIAREDYVSRWGTVSTFLAADETQRAEMTARIESVLERHDETRGRGAFSLPQLTDVYLYRRLP